MTVHRSVSKALRYALHIAVVSSAAVACSPGDPASSRPAAYPGTSERERETTIVHEPCDASSKSAQGTDINGDGKPDIVHVMEGGRELCRVLDLNADGAIDAFVYFDAAGLERRRESDFDRDGRADEIAIYKDGKLVQKQRETNFDDKIDTWDYYEGDRLVRRERDSDGDAIVDQWWTFNRPTEPKCALVASDANGDGRPDPNSEVDTCSENGGVAPPPGASPPASAMASAAPAPAQAPSAAPASKPTPSATHSASPAGKPAPSAAADAMPTPAPSTSPTAQAAADAPKPKPQPKASSPAPEGGH